MSSSSGVSLSEVISSPSGKGKRGVVGIPCHLLQHCMAGAYQTEQSISMVHQKPGRAKYTLALIQVTQWMRITGD
jgi:hypothetical protein